MTDEAQGQSHDDTPIAPASTRWSEDPVQDDETLAPPYVPGRPAEPADVAEDEPFPFEAPFDGADKAEPSPEEDDFPFEQFDIEGEAAPRTEAEPDSGWSPASDVEWEPEPGAETAETADEEAVPAEIPEAELVPLDSVSEPIVDVEPEAAYEVEPEPAYQVEPEPAYQVEPEVEPEVEPVATVADGVEEEVARLLDRLAGLIREEGAEAVRREMDSSDRLTALLSGLVAGYLSGRS